MVVRWGYIVAAKIKLSSNCVKPTGTWVPDCEFVIFPYKVKKMRKYHTYVIHIPYIYHTYTIHIFELREKDFIHGRSSQV